MRAFYVKTFLSGVLLFCAFSLVSAGTKEIPSLAPSDIPGVTIIRNEYFDGKSLWGYIDGGADVYLEYGFNRLLLQEINFEQKHIRLEIYQMKDSASAFGIFSISRFKCSSNDTLSRLSCISPYQLQVARNDLYISIINDNGTPEEQLFSLQVADIILRKTERDSFRIPPFFEKEVFKPFSGELKFFKGKLGIQNGFPAWADQFENFNKFTIYLLPAETQSGYAYSSLIRFYSDEDLLTFYKLMGFNPILSNMVQTTTKNGIIRAIRLLPDQSILYLETGYAASEAEAFLKALKEM